jgi:AbrB family looped-hinge helix DNA binding protein
MLHGFKLYGSATVGSKGQIVIPAEAREELGLKEGEKLVIVREPRGGGLLVLKAQIVEDFLGQMQSDIGSIAETIRSISNAE